MWSTKRRQLAIRADDPGAGEPFCILAQALGEDGELVTTGQTAALARIEISGALVGEKTFFGELFGGQTSYGQIQAALDGADASPANTTELVVRSPGGDSVGMGEIAAGVRNASNRVVVWGPKMFSAAYGLASGAKTIAMPPDGLMGSLSTFTVTVDESAAAEKAGVKVRIHSPDAKKGAGIPGAPIPEEALREADELAAKVKMQFADVLAAGREGLDLKALEPLMKAQVFTADEALEAGLIDQIFSTEAEFIASLFPTNDTEEAAMADTKQAEGEKSKAEESAAGAGATQQNQEAGTQAAESSGRMDKLMSVVETLAAGVEKNTASIAALAPHVAQSADDRLRATIEATGINNVDHHLKMTKGLDPGLVKEYVAELATTSKAHKAFASMGGGEEDIYETTDAAGEPVLIDRAGGMKHDVSEVDPDDAKLASLANAHALKAGQDGSPEYDKAYDSFCAKADRKEAQA